MVRNELNTWYSWDELEGGLPGRRGRVEGRLQVKRRKDEVGGGAEQEEGRRNTAGTPKEACRPPRRPVFRNLPYNARDAGSILVKEPGSNTRQEQLSLWVTVRGSARPKEDPG